jgi:hypothetical protein
MTRPLSIPPPPITPPVPSALPTPANKKLKLSARFRRSSLATPPSSLLSPPSLLIERRRSPTSSRGTASPSGIVVDSGRAERDEAGGRYGLMVVVEVVVVPSRLEAAEIVRERLDVVRREVEDTEDEAGKPDGLGVRLLPFDPAPPNPLPLSDDDTLEPVVGGVDVPFLFLPPPPAPSTPPAPAAPGWEGPTFFLRYPKAHHHHPISPVFAALVSLYRSSRRFSNMAR